MNFIDLKAQYNYLQSDINMRINNVLSHGNFIMGPEVIELEKQLGEYVGVKHVITCANGTDALSLALMSLNIEEGDAIFCPTFTFFATAEVIAHAGARPIFVDSDRQTYNLCTHSLENEIIKTLEEGKFKPKAIIAVDLFGLPANYPEIKSIAKKYNLYLLEDGAQGFGGQIGNKMACSFGDISTTSFFPAKPLGCYGDGGAIFTNNTELANTMKSLRVHGKGEDKYDNIMIGMNSRLDTIQAAILISKLNVFPNEVKSRNDLAEFYNNIFRHKFVIPFVPKSYKSSWAQYTLQSPNRDAYTKKFLDLGIPIMIYYPKCLHQQSAFSYLEYKSGDFPVAELLANEVFSVPMHPYFSDDDYAQFDKLRL